MTALWGVAALVVGVALGVLVERTGFCLFAAMAEGFGARTLRRAPPILAAMAVFSLVHVFGFRGNPP